MVVSCRAVGLLLALAFAYGLPFAEETCTAVGRLDAKKPPPKNLLLSSGSSATRTSFLIAKRARVGSTLVAMELAKHPAILVEFEVRDVAKALRCERSAPRSARYRQRYRIHNDGAPMGSCGASTNAFSCADVRALLSTPTPRLVVQLRWNVVERAVSAHRMFHKGYRQTLARTCGKSALDANDTGMPNASDPCVRSVPLANLPDVVRGVKQGSEGNEKYVRTALAVEARYAVPTLFLFYEDLVQDARGTIDKLTDLLGVPRFATFSHHLVVPLAVSPLVAPNLDDLKLLLLEDELRAPDYLKMMHPNFNSNVNSSLELHTLKLRLLRNNNNNNHEKENLVSSSSNTTTTTSSIPKPPP
mmetsp:Transcript_10771/g.35690  ORF Transcript_10771/g.35690 Transcript_10771/m.35690 type:complete len:359 (-) Transcript_10771:2551-3627(-)